MTVLSIVAKLSIRGNMNDFTNAWAGFTGNDRILRMGDIHINQADV